MFCGQCGTMLTSGQRICPACGYVNVGQKRTRMSIPQEKNKYSMKWFKLLINLLLFLAAYYGIKLGCYVMSGMRYYRWYQRYLNYLFIDGLKLLDTVIGGMCIICSLLAFVARFLLADFRKSGIVMYFVIIAVSIILLIIYTAGICVIFGTTDFITPGIIMTLVIAVAYLIANIIYFMKRKQLFVN